MPITLQFGPWTPDQSDTPIQVQDNQGPMTVPLADCLNVFFQNGSYKSIASPAASTIDGNTIVALNEQALAAFSYYDNVAQQETVFVGTEDGIQQLNPDGSWSTVPFISALSVGLLGASFSFGAGNFLNTNTLKGSSFKFTTGSLSPVITGISFVAGEADGPTLHYAGVNEGHSGSIPNFGTIQFANIEFGNMQSLMDITGEGCFLIIVSNTDPTQSAFSSIQTNGITQTSASAIYTYVPSTKQATWEFPLAFGFAQGTTYQVLLA